MTITVYTTPNCQQCRFTKHWLDKAGIEYRTADLLEDPNRLQEFKDAGYGSAPIVQTDEATWSGFRPDLLATHAGSQAKH